MRLERKRGEKGEFREDFWEKNLWIWKKYIEAVTPPVKDWMFVSPHNSTIEILFPNVMGLGGKFWEVIRLWVWSPDGYD